MKQASARKKINYYLVTWVGSYLLILVLPIILGSYVYNGSVQLLSEEIEKVHQKSMAEMRIMLDSAAGGTNSALRNIALNPTVVTLAAKNEIITPTDKLAAQDTMKILSTYLLANNNIGKVGVYFHKAEYLLTNMGSSRNTNNVYLLLAKNFGSTQAVWEKMMSGENNSTWYFTQPENIAEPPQAFVLTNMNNGVLGKKGAITCVIAVDLSPQFMQSMQNMAQVLAGDVWLISGENGYITTSAGNRMPAEYDSKSYSVFDEISVENGWHYVAVTSNKHVYEKVIYIKQLIWTYIVLCLIIGGILAYILARRYYNPIHRISRLLAAQGEYSLDETQTQNKISYIQTSLTDLLTRYQIGQSTIHKQGQKLRYQWLEKTLLGEPPVHSNDAEQLALLFPYPVFMVIGFYIYDYSRLFGYSDSRLSAEDETMMNVIIQNVSEEILGEGRVAFTTNIAGCMIAVINMETQNPSVQWNGLSASFHRIMDIFTDMFGLDVSVAASKTGQGLDCLPVCYQQMHQVIEYIHGIGEERVIVKYQDLVPVQSVSIEQFTTSQVEKDCCDFIRRGQYAAAVPLLSTIFEHDLADELLYANQVPIRQYAFVCAFIEALWESGLPQPQLEKLLQDGSWERLDSSKQVFQRLRMILEIASDAGSQQGKLTMQDILELVQAYVKENYADPNLGVSGIANHFFIHPSQLSRTFKKQMGIGLLDYIHQQRIHHINTLLAGNLSLNDIALRTGYLNSLTMIRVYKRYENNTPGRYREQLRAGLPKM